MWDQMGDEDEVQFPLVSYRILNFEKSGLSIEIKMNML